MPITRFYKLHNESVLWPEHKSEAAVLELQATTPPHIFQTTYQGNPLAMSGGVFRREWWNGQNRYSPVMRYSPVARYISLDTAASTSEKAAFTAWTVGDLLPDYRLQVREINRVKLELTDLPEYIERLYNTWQYGELLRGIIIENKSTGPAILKTLQKIPALSRIVKAYNPKSSKPERWSQASVWCSLGCVLLPVSTNETPWLFAAEEEIFNVPGSPQLDQADAFAQLIIYLENYLSRGYQARTENK